MFGRLVQRASTYDGYRGIEAARNSDALSALGAAQDFSGLHSNHRLQRPAASGRR